MERSAKPSFLIEPSFDRQTSLVSQKEQVASFAAYERDSDLEEVLAWGQQLCALGLGTEAVLAICETLRKHVTPVDEEQGINAADRQIVSYNNALLKGFMETREGIVLTEQERIRSALQRSLSSFSLQMETASQVAHVAISILDLDSLLRTTVELIHQRFALYFAGIYFLEGGWDFASIRAGVGEPGRKLLAMGHRLRLDPGSELRRSLIDHRVYITGEGAVILAGLPMLAAARSEMVLPLISREEPIGFLLVQSDRSGAFSTQDATAFQVMADQLATAIQNARLYADARQRADELAAANARLQELDQLKSRFMQNVSHELRTPLSIIIGYVDYLRNGQIGDLNGAQIDALATIARSSELLNELINDIVVLVEVGTLVPTSELVPLRRLTSETLDDFTRMATEARVALQAELPPLDQEFVARVRPHHVRRVLSNLLSNALKFTDPGGEIVVKLWFDHGLCLLVSS